LDDAPAIYHMNDLLIDGNSLKIEDIININDNNICVILSEDARIKMLKSREVVEKIIDNNDIVYGINTGFGSLSSVTIDSNSLGDLQTNLVRSHACGVGKKMKPEHVIMMMLIRANSISKGYSGTRIDVVNLLISMINKNIAPVIPRIGSLGASGDLAPLSHLALAMIGEGDCMIKSEKGLWIRKTAKEALSEQGLIPLSLQAKEGLSLINGTSQMCTYLALAVSNLDHLIFAADAAIACSLEAIKGSHSPFDPRIHNVRPHYGQSLSAARVLELVSNSEINISHIDCDRVQDSYSFRCAPQVHGPIIESLKESRKMLEIEINSATDNPLVFPDSGAWSVISGGNFHGQNLSMASDNLAIACHELASISERRTNQILDPKWSNQKAFLANIEGLESGLMIVQYVSAALLSELKLLSNPTSVGNVPVSNGKEDHVSMGATGTYRTYKATKFLSQVIANELICSSEALNRILEKPGTGVQIISDWVSSIVAPLTEDRSMTNDCENISEKILLGNLSNLFR
jgi:histidine ammonia-lyase